LWCLIDKNPIPCSKPGNISWLQGILGLMADNQKIIKKNTYVFGKMVYIWQDFEKGRN
jgi:hypothetical protein